MNDRHEPTQDLVQQLIDRADAAEAKLAAALAKLDAIGPMCRDVLIDLDFAHAQSAAVDVADLAATMAAVCRILDGRADDEVSLLIYTAAMARNDIASVVAQMTSGFQGAIPEQDDFDIASEVRDRIQALMAESGHGAGRRDEFYAKLDAIGECADPCSDDCRNRVGMGEHADRSVWHHIDCPNHTTACCPWRTTDG